MNASEHETQTPSFISWSWINLSTSVTTSSSLLKPAAQPTLDLLRPIRTWLDNIRVENADLARSICKLIPAQCPFERDIQLLGRTILHIPPMCKLNPLYEQVVALRFRALCYLADVCGEDVTPYC